YLLGPVHAWLDRAEVEIPRVCGHTDGRWFFDIAIVSSPEPKGQAVGCTMEGLCNAVNTHASVAWPSTTRSGCAPDALVKQTAGLFHVTSPSWPLGPEWAALSSTTGREGGPSDRLGTQWRGGLAWAEPPATRPAR